MPGPPQPTALRAFIAACLPQDVREELRQLQRQLEERVRLRPNPIRWTPPDQIHLTLRFLGNIQANEVESLAAALRQATTGIGPIPLSVRTLGAFPSWRRPSVIWVGLHGELEPLLDLQARVERHSAPHGTHSETRAFHPHLTLGRVRPQAPGAGRIGEALSEAAVHFGAWQWEEIALIRSQLTPRGSVYTALANFKLLSP